MMLTLNSATVLSWSMRARSFNTALELANQRISTLAQRNVVPTSLEIKQENDGWHRVTLQYEDPR